MSLYLTGVQLQLRDKAELRSYITGILSPPSSAVNEATSYPSTSFLTYKDINLDESDHFAGSWWQSKERFMPTDLSNVGIVEDNVWHSIYETGRGDKDILQALDWLDFSVEHLSKWWKETQDYDYAIEKLTAFSTQPRPRRNTWMNTTLAIIPYGVKDSTSKKLQKLWMSALTATVTSLMQFGVARVVVVGYYKMDEKLASRAFSMLSRQMVEPSEKFSVYVNNSDTELSYVHSDDVVTKFIKQNIPKAALVGLQEAMTGKADDETTVAYVGPRGVDFFQYIFMTESDQILNARLSRDFLDKMDLGYMMIPHRLQPFPHHLDVQHMAGKRQKLNLPSATTAYDLNSDTDACCDINRHLDYNRRPCGDFWWKCGLRGGAGANFSHLKPYDFIRLEKGTGIVSLAAKEHSRPCRPVVNGRGSCVFQPVHEYTW
jgi:hypothetical protein